MKTLRRAAVFALKLAAAIVIGNVLFRIVAGLPFDMPYGVDMAVRRVLHLVGRDDLANPDDMEAIVGLAVAAVATVVGAGIVWGGHALIRRTAHKGRSNRVRPS